MNRFFTLLFAAYGLAVYGQDNLIGEVYLSFQSSYNTVAIDGCEVGLSYMLQIEGTYGVANGSCNRDAAFGNFGNPTPHCQWVWNDVCDGCQDHRPTPDIYNPDHVYSYPFIAVSSEQTFHFQDQGGAGDNCGGLTMRIFAAGNVGCTSTSACNYDSEAVHDDGSCLYPDACGECEGNGLAGCTDALACNFNEDATCDDGGCDYSCCPGPGCCLDGQHWDWELGGCVITNPADINQDGCVQLNDLLDLLSAFGDCGSEESPWQCGDPLEYQGYAYTTVQIGAQCWFAENLRAENYTNEDVIPDGLSNPEWVSTTTGARSFYGEDGNDCNSDCDEALNLAMYGRMYNGYAIMDERGVCPQSWSVGTDADWKELELLVGMNPSEIDATGFRGVDEGQKLKASQLSTPPWNGTNEFDMNISAGSGRSWSYGTMWGVGIQCCAYYWTSTFENTGHFARVFSMEESRIERAEYPLASGMYVRCIKDAE